MILTWSAQASYRDRTNEFRAAVESARRHAAPSSSSAPAAASGSSTGTLDGLIAATSARSEFNNRTSKIGLGIHQTSQKLSRLAKLAKRTSVFDDPTVEIQELTAVIKKDITALNTAVVDLQALCNSQNESGSLSKDTTNHSTTVVDNLKNRLMSATKEFKEVLTMRTENLKVHENRRQMFSSAAAKDASNPFIRQRPLVARDPSESSVPPAPWASDSASTPLFQRCLRTMGHLLELQWHIHTAKSSYPFEIWIIPRQHISYFHEIDQDKALDLGSMLKTMLQKLAKQLNDPPFNFMIHSAPFGLSSSCLPYTHWFLQIVPQLSVVGGFELGSGCYINPVFPEDAAKILRELDCSV